MITRTARALAALLTLAVTLAGWPLALLWAGRVGAEWLPDLSDPGAVLAGPDSGGLFLLIVLALGWIAWAVWVTALLVEVVAQVRGIPTPHLGGLFPQHAAAALVTAVALLAAAGATTPALAQPPFPTAVAAVAAAAAPAHPGPAGTQLAAPAGVHTEVVVERGDTLWAIADEQLGDPTRYPEIAAANQGIPQPDGRHLSDPDLIIPGWTLHLPTPPAGHPASSPAPPASAAAATDDAPPTAAAAADPVVPPATPLAGAGHPTAGGGPARSASVGAGPAGNALPDTPLHTGGREQDPPAGPVVNAAVYDDEGRFAPEHGVLGLPNWIVTPLKPTPPDAAEALLAAAHASLAGSARAGGDQS